MSSLIVASLLVNVLVLVPVTMGMMRRRPWARDAYGGETPAQRILLAIYLAIVICSLGLLGIDAPEAALGLFAVQIIYKLLTPVTVGTLRHPVVLSNLGIAAFHTLTVASYGLFGPLKDAPL